MASKTKQVLNVRENVASTSNATVAASLGTVISPDLRNPKNSKHAAAHSIFVSWFSLPACNTAFIFLKMFGETGNLSLFPAPCLASCLLTPCRM